MRPPVLAACAVLSAVPAAAQLTLVAPAGYASVEGNANNPYPWNRGAQSMRIQFVHDGSHFTSQGVAVPVLIQRLRYRPDAQPATWSGGTWPNVRIALATCPVDFAAVSTTFDANLGPDATVVHQGPVTVQPGTSGSSGPQPWHVDIVFATPFPYDPAAGDLVVDVQLDGGGWTGSATLADHVSSTAGPPPLASRVFSTAAANATTGTVGVHYSPVCEIGFVPASGLLAAFTATPTRGTSPLTVQFTDQSFSTAPGGVTGWQWDFDGDGVTDSTQRHPTHTFAACGDFDVTLRVIDGAAPPATATKPAFVRTDEIDAAFDAAPLGGGNWQLTDHTTPPALAWAWDFDGDGVTDSTQQNPVVSFGGDCSGSVRLVATRHCRTSVSTRSVLQSPAAHSASLTAGIGTLSAPSVGTMFDLQVLPAEGVLVCGLTTATYTGTGPFSVSVYVTPGSYVGKDTSAQAWRLVGSGRGIMNGGTPAAPSLNPVALEQPFYLPAGSYGVAVWHTVDSGSAYVAYTVGSAGPYGNADLVVHPAPAASPGLARTAVFGGAVLQPRQWNGTFHYTRLSLNGQGGYGVFGHGCAGSLGVPGNVVRSAPALGSTMRVDLTNLPLDLVMYWWGTSSSTSSFGALPVDLAPIGAPGCAVHASVDATLLLAGANGTATFQFAVPGSAAIHGARFFTQGVALDLAANPLGLTTTDAAGFVVGQ